MSGTIDELKDKRIAILSPVAWRTPPRAYGAWETVASNITEGLVARGWKNVTLFATKDSITKHFLTSQKNQISKHIMNALAMLETLKII